MVVMEAAHNQLSHRPRPLLLQLQPGVLLLVLPLLVVPQPLQQLPLELRPHLWLRQCSLLLRQRLCSFPWRHRLQSLCWPQRRLLQFSSVALFWLQFRLQFLLPLKRSLFLFRAPRL